MKLKPYTGPHAGNLYHVVDDEGRVIRPASDLEAKLWQDLAALKQENNKIADLLKVAEVTGQRLLSEDNRLTADPLFCVFEKEEVVCAEGYNHDRIVWVDGDGEEASDTTTRRLDALHRCHRDPPEKWRRAAVRYEHRFVTACFTEQGCNDFLSVQGHNLRQPFIYTSTLFRNQEMKDFRAAMMELATNKAKVAP